MKGWTLATAARRLGVAMALFVGSVMVPACSQSDDQEESSTVVKATSLAIVAEVTEGEDGQPQIGPVPLDQLYGDLWASCYDSLVADEDGELSGLCRKESLVTGAEAKDAGVSKSSCVGGLCSGLLWVCVGYKALELGDAQDVVSFEVRSRKGSSSGSQTGPGSLTTLDLSGEKGPIRKYRIPPLPTPVKTLAYLMAQTALQQAASLFGWLGESDEPGHPQCMSFLVDRDEALRKKLSGQEGEGYVGLVQRYLFGLGEAGQLLAVATDKLARSQRAAAAGILANQPDFRKAQQAKWQGSVNSISALVGDVLGSPASGDSQGGSGESKARIPIPHLARPCVVELNKPSYLHAVAVLRAARVPETLDSARTDSEVADKVAQTVAEEMETDPVDGDAFLASHGLTVRDIHVARQYLQEELESYGATPMVVDGRVPALAARVQLGVPELVARLHGRPGKVVELGPTYADSGAAPALDYLREAARNLLRVAAEEPDRFRFTDGQRRMLASAISHASDQVGAYRVVARVKKDGERYGVSVQVQGVRPDQKVVLVRGEAGARCYLYGSINGAPCDREHYILAQAAGQAAGGRVVSRLDYVAKVGVDLSEAARGETVYLALSSSSPSGNEGIIGGVVVAVAPDGSAVQATFPGGRSRFSDIISSAVVRDPDHCGYEEEVCQDVAMPRGYVPPLENELTEDSDPYENSWKHYLLLAQQAAAEADRLGEQLVDAGLTMDQRSEAARQELEDTCGGTVTDPAGSLFCDPDQDPDCTQVEAETGADMNLEDCVGGGLDRVPYVALGGPVCWYARKGADGRPGLPCSLGSNDATGLACPIPARMTRGEDTYVTDAAGCEQLYRMSYPGIDWDSLGLQFVYLDEEHSLHLIEPDRTWMGWRRPDCEAIARIRRDFAAGAGSRAAQEWLAALKEQDWWLSPSQLDKVASGLSLETGILAHAAVKFNGRTLWDTRSQELCPTGNGGTAVPELPRSEDCGPPVAGQHTSCADGTWLHDELAVHMRNRFEWSREVRNRLFVLGLFLGRLRNIQVPRWKDLKAPSEFIEEAGNIPGYVSTSNDCTAEPCSCANPWVLPNGGGCDPTEFEDLFGSDGDFAPALGICHPDFEPGSKSHHVFRPCTLDMSIGRRSRDKAPFWNEIWYETIPNLLRANASDTGMVDADFRAGNGDSCGLGNLHLQILGFDTETDWRVVEWLADHSPGWVKSVFRLLRTGTDERIHVQVGVDATLAAVAFVCAVVDSMATSRVSFDPAAMPQIEGIDDLHRALEYIEGAANQIMTVGSAFVLPRLPLATLEGVRAGGVALRYPRWRGQVLSTLIAIESDLRQVANILTGLKLSVANLAMQLRIVEAKLHQLDIQKQMQHWRHVQQMVQDGVSIVFGVATAVLAFESGQNVQGAQAGQAVVQSLVDLGFSFKLEELQNELNEYTEDQVYAQAMLAAYQSLGELQKASSDLANVYGDLQRQLSNLDRLQDRARDAYARMTFQDTDDAGQVIASNTVMRRRYNTLRVRYERALARAKKLAFIAKRAIEFRLGVDMRKMKKDMVLVPAPATWEGRVCELEGFDYSRIRDADDPLVHAYDGTYDSTDNYAHMYVSDYVQMLSDFVESYNMDYPFSDESDVAVLSVKDDLMKVRRWCEVESYNELYWSEEIGSKAVIPDPDDPVGDATALAGWYVGGCLDEPADGNTDDGNIFEPTACVGFKHDVAVSCRGQACFGGQGSDDQETMRLVGERIWDATEPYNGYVDQTVRLDAGHYILSWWACRPEDPVGMADYAVALFAGTGAEGDEAIMGPLPFQPSTDPNVCWTTRQIVRFEVTEAMAGPVTVRFYPSSPDSAEGNLGDVVLWGLQLERVDPRRMGWEPGSEDEPAWQEAEPLPYEEVRTTRMLMKYACEDLSGSQMRSRFRYRCLCGPAPGHPCAHPERDANRQCYWEYPFRLSLEDLEQGRIIPSLNVALGNFNYRQDEFAVNLVGTNVKDCQGSEAGNACYGNEFLPYDLVHSGRVQIRNYDGDTEEYQMPVARIQAGKALTAEAYITNPPSSQDTQMLGPYFKSGLRGRPLQGRYLLRIWDTPELSWHNVRDIQLVIKYRYWTRMILQ